MPTPEQGFRMNAAVFGIILNLSILKFFAEVHGDFDMDANILSWHLRLKNIRDCAKKQDGTNYDMLILSAISLRDSINDVVGEKCSDDFLDRFWDVNRPEMDKLKKEMLG